MEMLEGGGLGSTQGRGVLTGLGTSTPHLLYPRPPASVRPSSPDVQSAGGGSEVSAPTGNAGPGRAPSAGPPLRARWRWLLRSFACVWVSNGRLKRGKGKGLGPGEKQGRGGGQAKGCSVPKAQCLLQPHTAPHHPVVLRAHALCSKHPKAAHLPGSRTVYPFCLFPWKHTEAQRPQPRQ